MCKEKLSQYGVAVKATIKTAHQLLHSEPRSAFRKAAVASLVYAGECMHVPVSQTTQRKIAWFIEASVVLNNLFDEGRFNSERYTQTVSNLIFKDSQLNIHDAETFHRFLPLLEQVETQRPQLDKLPSHEEVKRYREVSNLINLAGVCAIAFSDHGLTLDSFLTIKKGLVSLNPSAPPWFKSLFYSTMALQVIDDIVGIDGDVNFKRPSFFTAHISRFNSLDELTSERTSVISEMRKEFSNYCRRAKAEDQRFYTPLHPMLNLGLLYPAMTELSVRSGIRFPGLTSSRDMVEHRSVA